VTTNYTPDPKKVARAVERAKTRAESYINDPEKSKHLLDEALKKAQSKEKSSGPINDFWRDLKTLFRLLKAYSRKEYTRVAWGSIILATVAVIYFVSPIDLMPDWFPVVGFVDDAAVVVFVIAQIKSDLAKFLVWEQEKNAAPEDKMIIDL
jgi:uncharacterized membrane protein YkvA (DUF1232 family)